MSKYSIGQKVRTNEKALHHWSGGEIIGVKYDENKYENYYIICLEEVCSKDQKLAKELKVMGKGEEVKEKHFGCSIVRPTCYPWAISEEKLAKTMCVECLGGL